MTNLRKIMAVILAITMIMSLAVSVVATTYTITINNEVADYEYTAYQIFAGDLSVTTLSNIVWGNGLDATSQEAIITYYSTSGQGGEILSDSGSYPKTAAGLAAALADGAIDAEAFAKYIAENCTLQNGHTSSYSTNYTISGLDAGYYLVVNNEVPATGTQISYSAYMLKIVGNVTVDPKSSVPELDKTVEDINDSNGSTEQDDDRKTADYNVGDDVPFTLTATIGDYYEKYDTYKLVFHDKLSDGLSFNSDTIEVTVYTAYTSETLNGSWVGGTAYYTYDSTTGEFETVDTGAVTVPQSGVTYYTAGVVALHGYTLAIKDGSPAPTDDCSFEVQITNTDGLYNNAAGDITITSGTIITVTYTAELLTSAEFKETNTAKLEYSNNPNNENEVSETPEVISTVFDYTLTVNKVDDSGTPQPLEGAGFTLYKMVVADQQLTDGDTAAADNPYYTYDGTNTYTKVQAGNTYDTTAYVYYEFVAVGDEVGQDTYGEYTLTSFNWTGLDDGVYKIEETTTPDGYNTMDDDYFAISATHSNGANGGEVTALQVFDVSEGTGTLQVTTTDLSGGSEPEYQTVLTTGVITHTIQNNKGTELPETGGIGTTIFYVVGGILVVGAVVLLITKKRLGNKED